MKTTPPGWYTDPSESRREYLRNSIDVDARLSTVCTLIKRLLAVAAGATLLAGGRVGCSSAGEAVSDGTKMAAESPRSTSSKSAAADAPKGAIEAVGFGRPADSDYMYVVAIVKDVAPGQYAKVSFNVLDPEGEILKSESASQLAVNPNSRMILVTQVTVPKQNEVTRVEATLGFTGKPAKQKLEDLVLEVGPVSVEEGPYSTTAEAVITNPSDQQIDKARIGVACFDVQGNIIGGGYTFTDLVSPGAKVKVDPRIMVSQLPDRCEMSALPSNLS